MAARIKPLLGRSRVALRLANRLRGQDVDAPVMQMLPVRFDAVASLLRERGVEEALVHWTRYGSNTSFQVHAALPADER